VRCFIERAQGRTSSYVISDIGATEFGRWHVWQLRCRIGATSFVKVGAVELCVATRAGTKTTRAATSASSAARIDLPARDAAM
jgi:hypothetical protein